MALLTKFNIGNYSANSTTKGIKPVAQYNVLNYQMLTRCSNDGFYPTSAPKTEYVEITLKCDEIPLHLYTWYENNWTANACIDVQIPDGDGTRSRSIIMEGAQCYAIEESYNQRDLTREVKLSIVVEKLSVENNIYKRS